MAKKEKKEPKPVDSRPFVFDKAHEASSAAKNYRETDVNKEGEPLKWRVFKVESTDGEDSHYVVSRSKNAAVVKAIEGRYKATPLKKPNLIDPAEFVSALDEDEVDALFRAIDERKNS